MSRTAWLSWACILATAGATAGCEGGPWQEAPLSARYAEAEAALVAGREGDPRVAPSWSASGGNVVLAAAPRLPTFVLEPGDGSPRHLWLRLSCAGGAELAASIGGRYVARIVVPDSLHQERFEWLDLGSIGAAERYFDVVGGDGAAVAIDELALLADGERPDESRSPAVWRSDDRSLELRAAFGASVADPEWTLHLLREQRDVVATILGRRLARPLVLFALPAASWPSVRTGAFQNGGAIFLREEELHLPWRGYAHEIVHVHEEERGVPLPWFLSEGIACAVALDVEAAILGEEGPVAAKERRLDGLFDGGATSREREAWAARPPFLLVGEPADDAEREEAYEWSTALVRGAARRGGEGFFRRLEAVIGAHGRELVAARRSGAAAAALLGGRLLEEAAGTDLADLFARAGLPSEAP